MNYFAEYLFTKFLYQIVKRASCAYTGLNPPYSALDM